MSLLRTPILITAALALLTSACAKTIDAPDDRGVCWHAIPLKNGQMKFNKLAENRPSLESCAVALEVMRIHFESIGARQPEIIGDYQGQFLFVEPQGIFTSQSLDGVRYLALVRTGDGRLAIPSAMPQR